MFLRRVAGAMAGVMAASCLVLFGAQPAEASKEGRRNTALVLTGVAAHQLIKGKTVNGLVAGAGAAYAWNQYEKSRKKSAYIARRRSYLAGLRQGRRSGQYASSRRARRSSYARRYRSARRYR